MCIHVRTQENCSSAPQILALQGSALTHVVTTVCDTSTVGMHMFSMSISGIVRLSDFRNFHSKRNYSDSWWSSHYLQTVRWYLSGGMDLSNLVYDERHTLPYRGHTKFSFWSYPKFINFSLILFCQSIQITKHIKKLKCKHCFLERSCNST